MRIQVDHHWGEKIQHNLICYFNGMQCDIAFILKEEIPFVAYFSLMQKFHSKTYERIKCY